MKLRPSSYSIAVLAAALTPQPVLLGPMFGTSAAMAATTSSQIDDLANAQSMAAETAENAIDAAKDDDAEIDAAAPAAELAQKEDDAVAVSFKGTPKDFAPKAKLLSSLASGVRRPKTLAAVRRAAETDAAALAAGLQAFGYYEGAADFRIEPGDDNAPPTVDFTLTPGPLYRVRGHTIIYTDEIAGPPRPPTPDALGVTLKDSAAGADIAAGQQKILSALWNAGYPEARAEGRRAVANKTAQDAEIVYQFHSGPRARFGALKIDGASRTKMTFLEKLKAWEDGDLFEQAKLVAYRDRLVATNLFASVDVAPGAPAQVNPGTEESENSSDGDTAAPETQDGAAPVLVTLEERKARTIGVGASFSTTEGPGGRLFFEYRNLFGNGENLRAEIAASEVQQSIGVDLNKPLPLLPGSAFANVSFINETPDAFTAQTFAASAGFAKEWLDGRLTTRAGLAFETSNIKNDDSDERTYFISAPLSTIWDTEDDPIALDKGERAALVIAPNAGSDSFVQMEFNARGRRHFGAEKRYTLAARTRLGASFASSLEDLPVTKRFFSGGGSSVRGYDFQAVGPLDEDNLPIGGRSVIEAALEVRAQVQGPFQAAAFIDAGSVASSAVPDFTGDYLIGVGAGLRYLSAIGPLRVDFAIPLEKRAPDRAWQLYISLGQPF